MFNKWSVHTPCLYDLEGMWTCCHFSCIQLFATLRTIAHQALLSIEFPSRTTGVGCHALLQGIFSSGLPRPSPGDLPNPGIQPGSLASPALAGRFFTIGATREAPGRLEGDIIRLTGVWYRFQRCLHTLYSTRLYNRCERLIVSFPFYLADEEVIGKPYKALIH